MPCFSATSGNRVLIGHSQDLDHLLLDESGLLHALLVSRGSSCAAPLRFEAGGSCYWKGQPVRTASTVRSAGSRSRAGAYISVHAKDVDGKDHLRSVAGFGYVASNASALGCGSRRAGRPTLRSRG